MQLDVGLLTALDALLSEKSVTGAAERMNRSVSAMSRTLTRLRYIVGDPLLVRAGAHLVMTPRAEQLKSRVRALIEEANSIFTPDNFDLATVQRVFVFRENDSFIGAFAVDLLSCVHAEAPGIQLRFAAEGDEEVSALREGQVDLDIGVTNDDGPELIAQVLLQEHFVGVVGVDHDLCTGPITAKRYASFSHVVASRRGLARGPIDQELAKLGYSRRIAMILPSHTSAMNVVSQSDLVGAVPATLAKRAARVIKTFDLPFDTRGLTIRQAWHPRLDSDAAHRWLRGKVRQVCKSAIGSD